MPPSNVLFVDDDSDEYYLFNEALEHSAIEVVLDRAYDGNQLIDYLLNRPLPYLVIMDLYMPYKDGVEALTEIRGIPRFERLPLIIYSTTKNEELIEECYKKGADLFILKPHDFEGMVKVVKKIFAIDWNNRKKPDRKDFVITGE